MNRPDALVLVVEDSRSMRESICDLLRDLGFPNVHEAANGADALALFQATPYDIVITDWFMPWVTGIELLKAIRSGSQRADTPVLVLTGTVTHGSLSEAVAAGATGFISKPFVAPELCKQVLELVAAMVPSTTYEPALELLEARS